MCFVRSKVGLDKNREKRAVGPLNGGEKFALNSVATVRRQIASSGGEERRNPTDVADGALEFRIVLATLSPTMAFCQPATWANLPGAQATLFRTWEISWCAANNCASIVYLESKYSRKNNGNKWNEYIEIELFDYEEEISIMKTIPREQ